MSSDASSRHTRHDSEASSTRELPTKDGAALQAPALLGTVAPRQHGSGSDDEEEEDIGPKLPAGFVPHPAKADDSSHLTPAALEAAAAAAAAAADSSYGGALRPGEGAAMASFVAAGQRIPRRGEVGWQGDDIAKMESVGYVMSGSRHKRMNEVRLRKENQVYTVEEKKALMLFNIEEKAARETRLLEEFKAMIDQKKAAAALAASARAPSALSAAPR